MIKNEIIKNYYRMFVSKCERHLHPLLEMKKTKRPTETNPWVYDKTHGSRSFSLISCRNLPILSLWCSLHQRTEKSSSYYCTCIALSIAAQSVLLAVLTLSTYCNRFSFHDWWVWKSLHAAHNESWSHKLLLFLLLLKLHIFVKMFI